MNTIDRIIEKSKILNKTIILPESMDERVLNAAEIITKEHIANLMLIGDKNLYVDKHPLLKDIDWIDPKTSDLLEVYVERLCEMRKSKGMTKEDAYKLLTEDYMYFACMLVIDKKADGIVSGACHSTSNTLRPALQIVKTKENTKLVSAFFLMEVPNCEYGENGAFVFADCGLNQNPTAEELAEIAHDSAISFENLIQKEAKVALLSHSTHGSAKHSDVDKVVNATNIAKESYPNLLLDGELQLDAAIIPEIAASKAPNSPLKGMANVLVFPDLDSGNIGYKLTQRLAKANAFGPLTQGMKYPINDLSRGCSSKDIVGVVAITSVQCEQ